MKPLKISFACTILFTILLFPVVLLMVTGKITLFDLHGFGVDTEEQVYLGTANGKILVWKDQQQIGTLKAPTSRSYQITVKDDEILCAIGSADYRMDLDGNILERSDDPTSSLYASLQFQRSCTTADGTTYRLRHFWGRTSVVRDPADSAVIVYQMSAGVFAAKVFLYVAVLGWIVSFVSIWYFAIRQMKKHPSKGGTLWF